MILATSSLSKDRPPVPMAGKEIDRRDFAAADCRHSDTAFERICKGRVNGGADKVKKTKEKFKLLYTATLYLMRSGIELIDAQHVIHLCTMQVVGSCGDDTSISNAGAFKFFFHLRASFLQYGP